ncbi:MAG: methionyl-tRNA formyltransferase [Dehalococcoidia bacterium]|nr:methionyl-tRNA formyltransferase [Dehalococcoidia bacterium]
MNERIVFMGTPYFGVPVLQSLVAASCDVVGVYTRPDRPAGRGRQPAPSPVKVAALAAGLSVWEPDSLRGDVAVESLRTLKPDLVVVAAFAYLLPPEVLQIPAYGCLNVHPSLLPRHRGPSPVAAALLNGDAETGVSIMLMDSGLDTGPVLSQERVTIGEDDTTGSLTELLAERGAALLLKTIDAWRAGRLTPVPQEEPDATYSSRISAADGLLDWSLSAAFLSRQVRAYQPWPGSHTIWKGQRLKVLRAAPVLLTTGEAHGTVIELSRPFRVGVSAGDGVLALSRLQLEGKREISAEEFVRGHRDFVGARLGQ